MVETNTSVKRANGLLGLQFLSDFGDQITTGLLALCLLDITQSTGQVGFVYMITTLGYVLFTLVGGILGDRLSRRKILFGCDLGRGLTVLLMIVAIEHKSIMLIYITSFLLSILGSLHRPVKFAAWAESIPNAHLERYNSLSELSTQVSYVIGPLVASFLLLREWTNVGFSIDALTFFVCAISFTAIISERKRSPQLTQKGNRDLLKGFKLIGSSSEMMKYISYDAVQMIGYGAFNSTFLVLAQRDFGWTKVEYSYHLSIVALCTTLGALCGATRYVAKITSLTKLIGCAVISGSLLLTMLSVQSFPLSSVLFGMCDFLAIITIAVTRTKAQLIAKQDYPDHIVSIIAARSIVIKGATLLGATSCLLIDDLMSLDSTLTVFAFPVLLSFVPLLIVRRREVAVASLSQAS